MSIDSSRQGARGLWGLRFVTGLLVPGAVALCLCAQEDDKNANHRDEALPLPQWSESGDDVLSAGLSLWPKDFNPNDVVHPAAPVATGDSDEDKTWSRFLPRFLTASSKKTAEAVKPLTELAPDAWLACEKMPADTCLFDPQGLLAETQAEDMRRLLSLHSGRNGVIAAMVLLDARQKLPTGADLTHLAGGQLTRNSACIIVYPLGEPDRARVFFTQNVGKTAEPSYLEGLASACIREAAEHPDAMEQLQHFAIQLSIRLFWLERAYPSLQPTVAAVAASKAQPPTPKPAAPAVPSALPVPTVAQTKASDSPVVKAIPVPPMPTPVVAPAPAVAPESTTASATSASQEQLPLSEVTPPEVTPGFFARIGGLLASNKAILFLAAGALVLALAVLVGVVVLLRWKRRRYRQCVWILPEAELPATRLGGPHCGASGAFIQYG